MHSRIFCISIATLFFTNLLCAQSQWKFYVAFEEGTGQKDTLWMVYDSAATITGVDTTLGEGYTPLDHSKFNVWIYNDDGDTTKTEALPFYSFPNHLLYSIRAINYTYPIIIRWDTSLFNSPLLPIQANNYISVARIDNDYFFGINNDPSLQAYNMLYDDTAYAPYFNFGSHDQFPMNINFYYDNVGIEEMSMPNIKIYPNPSVDKIWLQSMKNIRSINVIDSRGVALESFSNINATSKLIDISELESGCYCLLIQHDYNQITLKHFIKI